MANRLTKAKLASFYAAIGRFVIEWAGMEICLDILVLVARGPRPPHQLSEKIRSIRQNLAPKLTCALAKETLSSNG
jgi:hypothetical protein